MLTHELYVLYHLLFAYLKLSGDVVSLHKLQNQNNFPDNVLIISGIINTNILSNTNLLFMNKWMELQFEFPRNSEWQSNS